MSGRIPSSAAVTEANTSPLATGLSYYPVGHRLGYAPPQQQQHAHQKHHQPLVSLALPSFHFQQQQQPQHGIYNPPANNAQHGMMLSGWMSAGSDMNRISMMCQPQQPFLPTLSNAQQNNTPWLGPWNMGRGGGGFSGYGMHPYQQTLAIPPPPPPHQLQAPNEQSADVTNNATPMKRLQPPLPTDYQPQIPGDCSSPSHSLPKALLVEASAVSDDATETKKRTVTKKRRKRSSESSSSDGDEEDSPRPPRKHQETLRPACDRPRRTASSSSSSATTPAVLVQHEVAPVEDQYAEFNGEQRLVIDFDFLGNVSASPERLGRKGIIPDALSGSFLMYSERWFFVVNYIESSTSTKAFGVQSCLEWKVRNEAWSEYHSLVETLEDALRRNTRGVTLCNKVFTEAMELRAKEFQQLLTEEKSKSEPDVFQIAFLDGRMSALRPKRFSEGPLLFGLRHKIVQRRAFSLASGETDQEQRMAAAAASRVTEE